jgi:hypothetical protein
VAQAAAGEGVEGAEAWVGQRLAVLWTDDDAWYEGQLTQFNATDGKHLGERAAPHCFQLLPPEASVPLPPQTPIQSTTLRVHQRSPVCSMGRRSVR